LARKILIQKFVRGRVKAMEKKFRSFHLFSLIVLMLGLFTFIDASWAVTPKISAGRAHAIVVKSDGTLWGWGYNGYGQLGDGTTVYRHSPIRIGTEAQWADIVASKWNHTTALKSDGSLWGWGLNSSGQLGDSRRLIKLLRFE
jgi:alpha-tubulin suppressor-like RCC1 family protein